MAILNDPTVALRIAFNVITVGIAVATVSAVIAVSLVVTKGSLVDPTVLHLLSISN